MLRTDQTPARKTRAHPMVMLAQVWCGSVWQVKPGQARFFGAGNHRIYHMKIQILPRAALLILACALTLSACTSQESESTFSREESLTKATEESAAGYPVTITNFDSAGNEIQYTYSRPPERVVAVYQGAIETMIALGLEDRVIASYGLDNEVKPEWKEGLAAMNYQEAVFAPDQETVTLLQPDMIVSWGSLFSAKMLGDVSIWNEKGVATYMNSNTRPGGYARTLENEYTDILNLGRIFSVQARAEEIVAEMKKEVAQTLAEAEGKPAVRVAVVEPMGDTISNYGKSSLAGDMISQLGGKLANPDGKEMSKEDLLACDPDVIFVVYMAYSGDDPESVVANQMNSITADPALASLSAVQTGRVYPVMLGDIYAAGPRSIDGIKTLAAGMYPEMAA